MPKPIDEMLVIVCPHRGYLAPLKMMGPILHPVSIPKTDVAKLLLSGAPVHAVNTTTGVRTLLDITTFNTHTDEESTAVPPAFIGNPVEHTEAAGSQVPPVVVTTPAPIEEPPVVVAEPVVTEETPVVVAEPETTSEAAVAVEETTEAVATETTTADDGSIPSTPAFKLNADGTVDESTIDWTAMTKAQRKALRAEIDAFNLEAKKGK